MGTKAMSSHGGGGALSRQGSVCSLTFSEVDGQLHGVNLDDLLRAAGSAGKKTVDEVWRDIQGACPRAQVALVHDHEAGLKRAAADGGVVEWSDERRKKRMIKNRESAARSRARKQAYTNELENKISRLEEENERLRRHKALQPVVQHVPQLELKNQLRRTNSANF